MHSARLVVWLLLCYAQCDTIAGLSYEDLIKLYEHRTPPPAEGGLTVNLGRDHASGCYCWATDLTLKVVVCFGGYECTKFPRYAKFTRFQVTKTVSLKVRTTYMREVRVGDVDELYFIKILELQTNNYLKYIEPGTFRNLTNLETLSISYSLALTHLHEGTFRGLRNLRNLTMVNNAFTNLAKLTPALRPLYLPALQSLDLSENIFENIHENSFLPMTGTTLRKLLINLCQTDYIHPNALLPLKKLQHLEVGSNELNATVIRDMLNTTLQGEITLFYLDLSKMGFRKHPPRPVLDVIAKSQISELILSENQFELIINSTFPKMPNIELIDLTKVSTVRIDNLAFNPLKFPKLKALFLSGNCFAGIHSAPIAPQLMLMDLSHNSDITSPNIIYFEITKDNFANFKEMRILNLSYNTIKSIFDYTFRGLHKLKILNMENGTIYRIGLGTFLATPELEILNLANNPIRTSENLTSGQFAGLNKLRVLRMGNCGIKQLNDDNIFLSMPNLTHLYLGNNQIYYLQRKHFEPLKILEVLDLRENFLVPWIEPILYPSGPKLRKFLLSNNRLSHFSPSMLSDMNYLLDGRANITELNLTDNIFVCDCNSMYATYTWLEVNGSRALRQYFEHQPLRCSTPDLWEDRTVNDFITSTNTAKCLLYNKVTNVMILMWTTPTIVSLTFVILGVIALIRYKAYVKYWLFLAKIALGKRRCSQDSIVACSKKMYKYDAFVSYCNEDRDLVMEMVSHLETEPPYLKLCVYERDFEIGSFISESIFKGINDSRYIVLMVSDAFARSHWCRWETQVAEIHRHSLGDGSLCDPLILIRVGNLQNKSLNPTLKYLMKTKIYLCWNDRHTEDFWRRLRNILGKK